MLESSVVSAAAPAGARVNTIKLPLTHTDSAGRFTVSAGLGLANRAGFVEPTDQVSNFQVSVWDDRSEIVWAFPASPSTGGRSWRTLHSLDAPAQLVFDLGSSAQAYERANDPRTWIDAENVAEAKTAPMTSGQREAREQDGNCWYQWTDVYWYDRLERFINIHNSYNSPATSFQSTSVTHTLGLASRFSGGSWGPAGTASVSLGSGAEVTAGGLTDRGLWNSVNMRQRVRTGDYGCSALYVMQTVSTHSMLKKIEWIPFHRYTYGPNHAYGGTVGRTYTLFNSTNATFGTGLDTPYVDLSAQSGWGATQKLSFFIRPYERAAHYWTSPLGPIQSGNWSWEDE